MIRSIAAKAYRGDANDSRSNFVIGAPPAAVKATVEEKEARATGAKKKVKNDPRHVAAARELRDRYLEQFNIVDILPGGKYSVGRASTSSVESALAAPTSVVEAKILPHAA